MVENFKVEKVIFNCGVNIILKDENHTIRKTDEEIFRELDKTHKDLEVWADKLPTFNK